MAPSRSSTRSAAPRKRWTPTTCPATASGSASPRRSASCCARRGRGTPSTDGGRSEERAEALQKGLQPVVVHPVAGALEGDDLGIAEMPGAPVLERIRRPALLAVDEEGRAGDPRP